MDRAIEIASRGWLGSAVSILTFGYFGDTVAQGKACAHLSMAIPGGTLSMLTPGGELAMVLPGGAMSMATPGGEIDLTTPGGTITIEDCD